VLSSLRKKGGRLGHDREKPDGRARSLPPWRNEAYLDHEKGSNGEEGRKEKERTASLSSSRKVWPMHSPQETKCPARKRKKGDCHE